MIEGNRTLDIENSRFFSDNKVKLVLSVHKEKYFLVDLLKVAETTVYFQLLFYLIHGPKDLNALNTLMSGS